MFRPTGLPVVLAALILTPAAARAQASATQAITVCVLRNNQLLEAAAIYNPATGDTILNVSTGPAMFRAYHTNHAGYAGNHFWYINSQPITVSGSTYVKYGLPRIIGPREIEASVRIGAVPVFKEAGTTAAVPEVVYIPVRPGCEFQPYMLRN